MSNLPTKIEFKPLVVEPDTTLLDDLTMLGYFTRFATLDEPWVKLREAVDREIDLLNTLFGGVLSEKSRTPPVGADAALMGLEDRFEWARRWMTTLKIKSTFDAVAAEMKEGLIDKVVFFSRSKMSLEPLSFMCEDLYPTAKPFHTSNAVNKWGLKAFREKSGPRFCIQRIGFPPVDLTAACHAVFIDPSWKAEENAQAAMTLFRRGQTRPVTIRFAALADTVDERIAQIFRIKAMQIVRVFDTERRLLDGLPILP